MSKIIIPKGWRRLRRGTTIRKGDKLWVHGHEVWGCTSYAGEKIGTPLTDCLYIRRITPKAKP